MKDEYWYPTMLGGSGNFDRVFEDWPYFNHPSGLKEYFLVMLGFHFGALVHHMVFGNNKDFIEMGLHHMVTVVLVSGVYSVNAYHCGAMVSILHDFSDIFGCISRVLSEAGQKKLVGPVFLMNMVLWFYTRLAVLPYMIYIIWNIELPSGQTLVFFFVWLHCMLICLHAYWFSMFCGMI